MTAYDTARELAKQSYEHWKTSELFSLNWFIMLIVLAIAYVTWIILLDKSRTRNLLLLGSLAAVWYLIGHIVLFSFFGFIEFKVSITPFAPPIFIVAVTLCPIAVMLSQQYSSSWKKYLLWSSIGMAFLSFVLLPVYSLLGIFEAHKGWNYFYSFLFLISGALISRVIYLWFTRIEQKHSPEN